MNLRTTKERSHEESSPEEDGTNRQGGSQSASSPDDDRFDFQGYLETGIPTHLQVSVVSGKDEIPKSCRLHTNSELDGVSSALTGKYKLNLVDVEQKGLNQHWVRALRTNAERNLEDGNKSQKNHNSVPGWKDPLPDKSFILSHHRREMEERKFAASDRINMLSEFEDCMDSLAQLGKPAKLKAKLSLDEQFRRIIKQHPGFTELSTLALSLPELTKVNDPSNFNEVCLKYKLTVNELMRFILQFERVKEKELAFKRQKAEYRRSKAIRKSLQREEEEPMNPKSMDDLKDLIDQRRHRYREKYGQTIKVHFYNGVTLIVDPHKRPEIVRVSEH